MEKGNETRLGEQLLIDEVRRCLDQSDAESGYDVLANDPWARQLSELQIRETVKTSLLCAEQEYASLNQEWGALRPSEYAQRLGIQLVKDVAEPTPVFPYFAFYRFQPPSITLAQTTIFRTQQILSELGLEAFLGKVDLEELAIAHELFHHLEHLHADRYTLLFHVEVAWFAGFRRKRHLWAAGEVGGRYFSKLAMGLAYSPRVYEIVLRHVAVRNNEYE